LVLKAVATMACGTCWVEPGEVGGRIELAVHLKNGIRSDLVAHDRVGHLDTERLVRVDQQLSIDHLLQHLLLEFGLLELRRVHGVAGLVQLLLPGVVQCGGEILLRYFVTVDLGNPGRIALAEIAFDAEEQERDDHQHAENRDDDPAFEQVANGLQHGFRRDDGQISQVL
jgi:hypothetical protein